MIKIDTDSQSYKYALSIMVESESDDALRSKMRSGDLFHQTPPPKDNEEAYERLKKLTGQRWFEGLKKDFMQKYGTGNEYTIKSALAPLIEFVLLAETAEPQDLYKERGVSISSIEYYIFEYLRIKHGFYPTNFCEYKDKNLDIIYGTYFLYKPWLENLLSEIPSTSIATKDITVASTTQVKPFYTFLKHPKPELFAIALKDKFNDEIGKKIKILITVLEEQNLIHYGNRDFTLLYNSMKTCFSRNIGAIQGIRDFIAKPTSIAHQKDFTLVKNKLETVLKALDAQ